MFDLSYLTAKPNQPQPNPNTRSGIPAESPPSCLSATSPGVVPLGTKPDATKPEPKSPPRPITPVIEALPCGCRINTTARTIHVPCDAHKRCPFCRGLDLVFNSKPEQVNCPFCSVRATRKSPLLAP